MADIDDELLALAGGDSEDERSVRSSNRQPSASPQPASEPARPNMANEDSDDEGEASPAPSTPNSLESAPMDESDSEAEQPSRARPAPLPTGAGDDEKYPVDGMFRTQAEKSEIMSLREVEREQIIADRVSEIERQRQNRLLRQMVTTVENEERKSVKKKRSADNAELDDDDRRASRQRTGKAAETAMDSLRRARAEKQRRKEDHERRKDDYSPRRGSRELESDQDLARTQSLTPTKEPSKNELPPPAELRDYEHVRLGRYQFAQVCTTPGFENAITGCYMRISVGQHPETGIEQYRMAWIKGFSKGRPYAMAGPNGQFATDQYVKAAHGKSVKEFPFLVASGGRFTDGELNRYQITCVNEGVTLPTQQFLQKKVDQINGLLNHNWTSEEIKARMAKRIEMKKRFDPSEREYIAQRVDEAVANGNHELATKLQNELDRLGTQRLAFRTSLGRAKPSPSTNSSEQDWLAERNREARRQNTEEVRKAQIREKAKVREMERALERGEAVPEDLSRRLRTKAKFVHDANETPLKPPRTGSTGSSPPGNATATPKPPAAKPQMAAHVARLQEKQYEQNKNKGVPKVHKPLVDDDVIGALDLDIDVEI